MTVNRTPSAPNQRPNTVKEREKGLHRIYVPIYRRDCLLQLQSNGFEER